MARFRIIPFFGLGVLAVYLAAALDVLPVIGTERLTLALVFAIGPVAIMGVLGIDEFLRPSAPVFARRVGTTFLIVAFALFNLMLVVQMMVRLQFREFRSETADPAVLSTLDTVFKGTNLVQQGIDVSFDVFYCLGVVILSSVLYRHRDFGRLIGAFGVLSASGLLILNLGTFPHPPAESGLVDLGPLTGLWWVLVIIQLSRNHVRKEKVVRGDEGGW